MTKEFEERIKQALEPAVVAYHEAEKKELEKYKIHKEFSALYLDLIIAFVKSYNYKDDNINMSPQYISAYFSEIVGHPEEVRTSIYEQGKIGMIRSMYTKNWKNGRWSFTGLPKFVEEILDVGLINELLEAEGVSISFNIINGVVLYNIEFDASILVDKRNELLKGTRQAKARILGRE